MGAVARETTFEQDEFANGEWLGRKASLAFEERLQLARSAAFPACERDVRVEGSAFWREADRLAGPLDFGSERGERGLRLDARPKGPGIALLEMPEPGDAQLQRRGSNTAQSV